VVVVELLVGRLVGIVEGVHASETRRLPPGRLYSSPPNHKITCWKQNDVVWTAELPAGYVARSSIQPLIEAA
jgi:hypothetical protein